MIEDEKVLYYLVPPLLGFSYLTYKREIENIYLTTRNRSIIIHSDDVIDDLTEHEEYNTSVSADSIYPDLTGVFMIFHFPDKFRNDFEIIREGRIQEISPLAKDVITKGSGLPWNTYSSIKKQYVTSVTLLMLNSPVKYAKHVKEKDNFKYKLKSVNFLNL